MTDATRSKSNMERLEETVAKLASNHLHTNEKLDALIHCIEAHLQQTHPAITLLK